MKSNSHHDKLVLPSRLEEVAKVEDKILSVAEAFGFEGTDRFAIKLALEEALANAIKHGNNLDPSKRVIVEFQIDSSQASITIGDEGPGFNPSDIPDPTLDENLDKPYGRGVMLMNVYMNEVLYNAQGNRVTLVKKRSNNSGQGECCA